MKHWKPKTVEIEAGELVLYERRKTPVHTILTNEGKPRSIVLSPIESTSFLSPEVSASLTLSPSSDSCSHDVEMEDSSNDSATTSIPSSVSSPGNGPEQTCPTVLIAVALAEDQRLQLDAWVEWLRDIPAIARHARVEGIYESNSTLMFLSLPVSTWDMIPENPAVSFIGFIKSQDFLKYEPSASSIAHAANSAPTFTSSPRVIEALGINEGLTLEKSQERSPRGSGQRLAETCTPQRPEQASAEWRCKYYKNYGSPSESNVFDTTQGGHAEKRSSTTIQGSSLKSNTLRDTTGGIQTREAASSPLRQVYSAVAFAYDTYIQDMELHSEYRELRKGLMIERYRTYLWKSRIHGEDEDEQGKLPTYVIESWAPFEFIFTQILETFSEDFYTVEEVGAQNSIRIQGVQSWVPESSSFRPTEHIPLAYERSDLLKSQSIATKSPPVHSLIKLQKTPKLALMEKKCIERLLRTLCYWNDSLEKLTPALKRESSRRRLRAHLSTSNTKELRNLEAAAAFLQHQDIELMAYARSVIEQERHGGLLDSQSQTQVKLHPSIVPNRIGASELEWQDVKFQKDRPRVMAIYRGESVIVDWQYCLNDSWRRANPAAYRRRLQSLTAMLNSGLWPLNLSSLHCIGYLDNGLNLTGYAFRIPRGVEPDQSPVTLHDLLSKVSKGDDIPDLGERFQLAKALVTTLFEIHNLGWLHKNIRPKNILFWPKPNSEDKFDISKPYLVGFDISRPGLPPEGSEKPLSYGEDDDVYRHDSAELQSFQPSFDMYSLGVVLYEIGFWRRATAVVRQVGSGRLRHPSTPYSSNSQHIVTLVKNGTVDSLKRFTGRKYRDAVLACLKGDFDEIWGKQEGDGQKQLHTYLDQVQSKIIDPISVCNA